MLEDERELHRHGTFTYHCSRLEVSHGRGNPKQAFPVAGSRNALFQAWRRVTGRPAELDTRHGSNLTGGHLLSHRRNEITLYFQKYRRRR